jgi:hypothetical protein
MHHEALRCETLTGLLFRACRARGARSTILQIDEIVGRAALIRRCCATFSQGRRNRPSISAPPLYVCELNLDLHEGHSFRNDDQREKAFS